MVYGQAGFSGVSSKVLVPLLGYKGFFVTSVEVTGGWGLNWVVWILCGRVEHT